MNSRRLLLLLIVALVLSNGWLICGISKLTESEANLVVCLDDARERLTRLEIQAVLHSDALSSLQGAVSATAAATEPITDSFEETLVSRPDTEGVSGGDGTARTKRHYLLTGNRICTLTPSGSAGHVTFHLEEGTRVSETLIEMGKTALELRRRPLEAQWDHLLDQIATGNYDSFDSERDANLYMSEHRSLSEHQCRVYECLEIGESRWVVVDFTGFYDDEVDHEGVQQQIMRHTDAIAAQPGVLGVEFEFPVFLRQYLPQSGKGYYRIFEAGLSLTD